MGKVATQQFGNILVGGRGAKDEDFVANKVDAGSPSDESDASESGGEVKEKQFQKVKKKAYATPMVASKKKKAEDVESGKKKKTKKNPNAPKRALSGFMYFSQAERESLRKSNPGISFSDVGRTLGRRWKNMSGEEKEPYEAKAREDKERYQKQMADYRSGASRGPEEGSSEEE